MHFLDMKTRLTLLSIFVGFLIAGISAQNISSISPALSDPGIPDGEEIRYITRSEDETSFSTTLVTHDTSELGTLYIVSDRDDERERLVTISRPGMIPLSSDSLSRVNQAAYESRTRLIEAPVVGNDEIFALGNDDLSFLLRGYPFDSPRRLSLHFLGQSGEESGFSLDVVHRRQERIELESGSYQAHKLELVANLPGAMSIFRAAIPKTFLWFNAEAPHQLLRFQGSAGFGDNSEIVTEMISYRRISRQ